MGHKGDFLAGGNTIRDNYVHHTIDVLNTNLFKGEVPVFLFLHQICFIDGHVAKCAGAASRATNPHIVAHCSELERQGYLFFSCLRKEISRVREHTMG